MNRYTFTAKYKNHNYNTIVAKRKSSFRGSKTPNVMISTKYLFNKNWIFKSEKIEKSSLL